MTNNINKTPHQKAIEAAMLALNKSYSDSPIHPTMLFLPDYIVRNYAQCVINAYMKNITEDVEVKNIIARAMYNNDGREDIDPWDDAISRRKSLGMKEIVTLEIKRALSNAQAILHTLTQLK